MGPQSMVRRLDAPQNGAIHLRPATELAERVLLPGDPHRALAVAQSLLDGPKMFNHTRGLWGYTGIAADGEPLTVQATGMGGPSAAIVTEELIALGARRLVRIGTCGALSPSSSWGTWSRPRRCCRPTARAPRSAPTARSAPTPRCSARLVAAGARPAHRGQHRPLLRPARGEAGAWVRRGACVVEMEAAAILQVAARRGAAAACVLAVTDSRGRMAADGWTRSSSSSSACGWARRATPRSRLA